MSVGCESYSISEDTETLFMVIVFLEIQVLLRLALALTAPDCQVPGMTTASYRFARGMLG